MKTVSPCDANALIKEAGRELAAFLLAVEQTQGAGYVEMAGTIWLNALTNQPESDSTTISSFRRVTVEASSSLSSAIAGVSPA